MTPEKTLFLALLRDHFSGRTEARAAENTDYDELARLAGEQSLAGVAFVQLKALGEAVPAEGKDKLKPGFFSDVFYDANRRCELNRVLESAGELPCMPFKGLVVRECWPIPELRTMGDIDLLVRAEDRDAWDRVMLGLGYEKYVDNHAVWTYSRQGIAFELHEHMIYEDLTGQADYRGFFDRAWEFAGPTPDPTFHLLYLLCHLAKHVVNSGMGYRGFLDLAFFCRANREALDLPQLERGLEKLRLMEFAATCSALCGYWFGAELPIAPKALDERFYRETTKKLFRDGTFGRDNEDNDAAAAARDIRRQGSSYTAGALALVWRKLFPPYRDMQLVPWYSFVDGRPWLMPAAWVYRWIYCLVHKARSSFALLLQPFTQKKQIDARTGDLRDWGL